MSAEEPNQDLSLNLTDGAPGVPVSIIKLKYDEEYRAIVTDPPLESRHYPLIEVPSTLGIAGPPTHEDGYIEYRGYGATVRHYRDTTGTLSIVGSLTEDKVARGRTRSVPVVKSDEEWDRGLKELHARLDDLGPDERVDEAREIVKRVRHPMHIYLTNLYWLYGGLPESFFYFKEAPVNEIERDILALLTRRGFLTEKSRPSSENKRAFINGIMPTPMAFAIARELEKAPVRLAIFLNNSMDYDMPLFVESPLFMCDTFEPEETKERECQKGVSGPGGFHPDFLEAQFGFKGSQAFRHPERGETYHTSQRAFLNPALRNTLIKNFTGIHILLVDSQEDPYYIHSLVLRTVTDWFNSVHREGKTHVPLLPPTPERRPLGKYRLPRRDVDDEDEKEEEKDEGAPDFPKPTRLDFDGEQ